MNITKRLYAYPVLNEEKDDYKSSKFDVDFECSKDGVSNLIFNFQFFMDNKELQRLMVSGDIEYVVHIECSNTSFRTTIHTIADQEQMRIPVGRINGKVEVIALIVSKNRIKDFTNSDWNEDYTGITFDISKGSILGYKNIAPIDIIKNYEEFSNSNSIFKIQKRLDSEPKPMEIELNSDYILLRLGPSEYDVYSRFVQKEEFQSILNSMIVLPALVYVFDELSIEGEIENYSSKMWFVSLERSYEKRGINLKNEIENEEKTSLELAQEAMELPLNYAFSRLTDLYENIEEEEDL